ncbi:MAG: toxin-antitoxin system YwqK family antitoxin [Bacteroidetes bacterium]|nr:toxin-antitoxin system YwqK family antitoxin [Bacteroidota bacterium]HET6243778.1 toxin-antitoxin system YwqK family antitoxin [Bacteroidia bacterium]
MKKYFIIILLSGLLGCQEDQIDDSSKRNENWAWFINEDTGKGSWLPISDKMIVSTGDYTLFFSTGEILEQGKIKDSLNVDTARVFNKSGELLYLKIFNDKNNTGKYYISDGDFTEYYNNGKLWFEGAVENHEEIGLWTEYDKDGNILWKGNFYNAFYWSSNYYLNGSIKDSSYFENNKQQGIYKLWYENGKISQITNWKDHLQDGEQIYFHDNGQLRGKEFWISGQIHGLSIHYHSNGNLHYESNHYYGVRNGLRKDFHDNGNLKSEGYFEKGVAFGDWLWYNLNGKLYQRDSYKNGKLISIEKID